MTVQGEAGREHVYLTGEERRALGALALEHAASRSFVMRVGLRLLAGMPVPPAFTRDRDDAEQRGEGRRVAAGG